MKPLRPAVAAIILTALLTVPAHADHRGFGGFVFVEPFFVPVPQRPLPGRLRQQRGYPVALVRQRLSGIGFSRIGQFDVYQGAYGVTATDPGGVRVNLVIDRWSGDIVRAQVINARPYRPPAAVGRARAKARTKTRKVVALRVPPLPRPVPERLTQMANTTPFTVDRLELEKTPSPAERDGDIVTSSISKPAMVPEIDPIGEPAAMSPPLAEAPPPVIEPPVEVAAVPKPPAKAKPRPVAKPVVLTPKPAGPVPNVPVTALQGERFDPADIRDPIAVY